MSSREPARTRSALIAAIALLGAMLVDVVVLQSLTRTSSSVASPVLDTLRGDHRLELGASGNVPDDVTVFDDVPAVDNLDADLLRALRRAASYADGDGVEIYVNSGWRSAEYQEQLFREAVAEYGSEEEAARWVATADTSSHVSGDAVDVGHAEATEWLSEHGAAYGLCQVYDNEPWHYELRPDAVDHGCPPLYADPTDDPRMQR